MNHPHWLPRLFRSAVLLVMSLSLILQTIAHAHDHTLPTFEQNRRLVLAQVARQALDPRTEAATCELTIRLEDARSGQQRPGLVRLHDLERDRPLRLQELILREQHWHAIAPNATVMVPRRRLRIEAFHGLETELARQEIDLTRRSSATVTLRLRRFYDARARGWRSGNTHLHLRGMARLEAERYLRTVTRADDLDLLFVSHLRRVPDDVDYITNVFTAADLDALSGNGAWFAHGEEHRHNFGAYEEGYGHVMFLLIKRLIEPVSLGPGIMDALDSNGVRITDGTPLERGIEQARREGATVIWCHNNFGHEDLPNWINGTLHAQNIFDGGSHGDYSHTFYRYLNLGLRVPFSTGTDWFMYDFSRVYADTRAFRVPMRSEHVGRTWLNQLRQGRTFITNGPLLEFSVDGRGPGDTVRLPQPASVKIRARGLGRANFDGLELIYNGEVVARERSRVVGGHYLAELTAALDLREPGWLAVRVPLTAGKNEFDRPLFAHTSPVYVEVGGRRIFRPEIANTLCGELQTSMETIRSKGTFANSSELDNVLAVYRRALERLARMAGD